MATTKNKQYNILFLMICIVAVAIVIGSNKSTFIKTNNDNSNNNQGGGDINTSTIVNTKPDKRFVYVIKSNNYFDIYTYNFESGKSNKVFTDRDENEKIIYAQSITQNGLVLAMMSSDSDSFTGNLYLINTDGSGKKEKVLEDFGSPQPPMISPDGQKIVYVLFSNAEKDFGFKIIQSNIDGSNKKQIIDDKTNLMLYAWSPDGNKIAYLKGQDNNLFIYDLLNKVEEKILTTQNEQINSLSWNKIDELVISKEPRGNNTFNQSEIFKLELNTKKLSQITDNEKFDNYPFFDNNNNLIYISKNYDAKINNINDLGTILLWQDNKIAEIIEANMILGWID